MAVDDGERGGLGRRTSSTAGRIVGSHELRRAGQVGLAERQAQAVERAGVLDQPGVDGQLLADRGDRRDRGIARRQQPRGVGEQPARPLDVVVVAGAYGGGLEAAGDVAGGGHGVRVGERLVEVGGAGGERGDPGAGVVHRAHPGHAAEHAQHTEHERGDHQHGLDAEQPARGGARPQQAGPHHPTHRTAQRRPGCHARVHADPSRHRSGNILAQRGGRAPANACAPPAPPRPPSRS